MYFCYVIWKDVIEDVNYMIDIKFYRNLKWLFMVGVFLFEMLCKFLCFLLEKVKFL